MGAEKEKVNDLYRGKCKEDGRWIAGECVLRLTDEVFMAKPDTLMTRIWEDEGYTAKIVGLTCCAVIPETIGKYMGEEDVNGNKIFEGDILMCNDNPEELVMAAFGEFDVILMELERAVDKVIGWHYKVVPTKDPLSKVLPFSYSMPITDDYIERLKMKIVGNIHDNPELWEDD